MRNLNQLAKDLKRGKKVYKMKFRRKISMPKAPHNTTEFICRNLFYRADTLREEDISEIIGTMQGIFDQPEHLLTGKSKVLVEVS